ncbi:putative phosphoglycerate mutase GpmB [Desulfolithobacter dissulfuricans]|uniref:Phosphoglycerate mutase GpmB n=1 Tax=Desulfolithobacter dissulfuricans TaxID=2795293 RepID=A0A915TYZ4_9BACT|nr:histidine phosphatase family protein [Desulfolithobacter dissulfuricans]BCO07815.1 putative phosphoglycerate mutase GpmB [Desulfolithobacter dissulfuricans]
MNNTPPTTLGLIRHARTLWNEERRIQGRLNSRLSTVGRQMARMWGRQLADCPWDRILASDLGRARETVELVNTTLDLEVDFDGRLREQDWGRWSGLTFPELSNRFRDRVQAEGKKGWDFRPPGGESRREVLARTMAALEEAGGRWPGQRILVVCHEGNIKCVLYHLLARKFLPDEPRLLRGYGLHMLEYRRDKLVLRQANALFLDTPTP